MRSHTISSPSVQESLETGRPNACNQCHLDKTLQWASTYLADWYQQPKAQLSDDEQTIAAAILWTSKGDAGQRALMAWSFGWPEAQVASGTEWMAPFVTTLMEDPYDAVRFIAFRSLRQLPGFAQRDFDFVGDTKYRSEVAREILGAWSSRLPLEQVPTGLLMDAQRTFDSKTFQRLIQQRDTKPVQLLE